jgi:hypothetical protein
MKLRLECDAAIPPASSEWGAGFENEMSRSSVITTDSKVNYSYSQYSCILLYSAPRHFNRIFIRA